MSGVLGIENNKEDHAFAGCLIYHLIGVYDSFRYEGIVCWDNEYEPTKKIIIEDTKSGPNLSV
jgi:hypothetical protein